MITLLTTVIVEGAAGAVGAIAAVAVITFENTL